MILLLLACEPEVVEEDTGFRVVGSAPADGDVDALESVTPELRLNAQADPETCTLATVSLVALGSDGSVAWTPEQTVDLPDAGRKISFDPSTALPRGWRYAYALRSGSDGCTDLNGRFLRPWSGEFLIP